MLMDPPETGLLDLPHDLLLTVLQQPTLGPRDLCRLEQTSRAIRDLLSGTSAWKRLFLHDHKLPVLGTPKSWKAEYAWRDDWSRTWRQRGIAGLLPDDVSPPSPPQSPGCIPSRACMMAARTAPAPKKVRRLFTMLPGVTQAGPPSVHVVDPSARACFASISAAMACARPHDTVLVAPGTYHERLEIDKPIDIVGMGFVGSVRLVGSDGPVVECACRGVNCRVAKLNIEQRATSDDEPMSGAVRVEGGAVLVLEDCTVTSSSGHCVVVKGVNSCGYILHNEIRNAKGVGVLACDHARGLFEDNDVFSNARAGVAILSGGNPVVRANKIHSGHDSGVLVSEKGRGRIEQNEIYGNSRAGVAILREGAPFVTRNKIHDGLDSGVLVCEQGMGTVIDNEIYANQMAGVAIGRGGASTVKGNTIRDGSGGSLLCLSVQSKGLIVANQIEQREAAELQVPETLAPEVQEQNLIRIIGQVHLSS
jgi:nitrous oxidase accessory protein NosD